MNEELSLRLENLNDLIKKEENLRENGIGNLLKAKELGCIKASDFILWKSWGVKL